MEEFSCEYIAINILIKVKGRPAVALFTKTREKCRLLDNTYGGLTYIQITHSALIQQLQVAELIGR